MDVASSSNDVLIVPVTATVISDGRTLTITNQVLSAATASVEVTVVRTDSQGSAFTTVENRPAIVKTTTDAGGSSVVTTVPGTVAPVPGEVRTQTDERGSTFITTYTSEGGRISSIKLITTTGADGRPQVIRSYTVVDAAAGPSIISSDSADVGSSSSLTGTSSFTSSLASPSSPAASGLSTGTKAGIGVGAAVGVIVIAAIAFLLGFKARRKSTDRTTTDDGHAAGNVELKAELDAQREVAELDGRGSWRWWGTRSQRRRAVRTLNAAEPQELPVEPQELPAEDVRS